MIRRMIIMLVAVAIVLGGYFAFQNFKAKMIHGFLATLSNPPQTVSTVVAANQQWQPQLQAVGSLRAVNGATLSLELAGVVEKIGFGRFCCNCAARTMSPSWNHCRPAPHWRK